MNPAPPAEFQYSPGFYDYIEQGARRSASKLLPLLHQALAPASVLDVGCGRGIWLEVWSQLGVRDFLGLDGDYLQPERLAIPPASFRSLDVSAPFSLGRQWALVQCLEVAEHIPPDRSETLVENLTAHADHILFSAAEPGQGGHNHINEQPPEYWRALFQRRGFQAYDVVRPVLHADPAVEPWYRFNALLFVRDGAAAALPEAIRRTALPPDRPIPRYANWTWRVRCWLLRPLPVGLVTALGRLKNRLSGSS